ncbi:MAG: creatininase family protein [Acidobacteria bacterium]|nr:creatininase family protein [Acidobacteriota bacterium]
MKRATVILGEMTNPEVEDFLKTRHTIIVPTGATEQHGPHAPLLTDVLIPQEIARRLAPQIGALVAPAINYALSYPHVGFRGLAHIRIPTFMALIEDLCLAFATSGFKRIIFLNGHYDNTYAIAYGCANAADRLPKDVKAFPINYWDGLTAAEGEEFSGLKNGLHANAAETSAILASAGQHREDVCGHSPAIGTAHGRITHRRPASAPSGNPSCASTSPGLTRSCSGCRRRRTDWRPRGRRC